MFRLTIGFNPKWKGHLKVCRCRACLPVRMLRSCWWLGWWNIYSQKQYWGHEVCVEGPGPFSGQLWVWSMRCRGWGAAGAVLCCCLPAEGSWLCAMELMGHLHIALVLGLYLMLLLFSVTKIPEGQMPPSVAREYPCGCSGFCSTLDKKGRKPKYPVPEPRPCPWPHSCTTWSTKATGSRRVTIVHC